VRRTTAYHPWRGHPCRRLHPRPTHASASARPVLPFITVQCRAKGHARSR
jgi:hypothetical protein